MTEEKKPLYTLDKDTVDDAMIISRSHDKELFLDAPVWEISGSKVVSRHGNKEIVSTLFPSDPEPPHEPADILFSLSGILNRWGVGGTFYDTIDEQMLGSSKYIRLKQLSIETTWSIDLNHCWVVGGKKDRKKRRMLRRAAKAFGLKKARFISMISRDPRVYIVEGY